ncbi:MAG: hypothetical protein ACT4PV_15310 [Planctomycetaceae bacterium]
MLRRSLLPLTLAGGVALACGVAVAGGKPGPSVRYAASWDEAVAEARALNLPLVVHRHGFY